MNYRIDLLGSVRNLVSLLWGVMGVLIEKKGIARHADGAVDPVLFLRGRHGWELELRLRNALEDFLTVDPMA